MLPFDIIRLILPLRKKLYRMYLDRAKQIAPRLIPFITKKDNLLDIGSGTGVISKIIKEKVGCKVTLVDVAHNEISDQYPLIIYDGKTLPFKNNQFSKTLLITVLHHCQDPSKVLDEAKRVTAGKIIIMEDLFTDLVSRVVTFIGDCLINFEIHSPFNNHTKEEWIKIFEDKKLKIEQFQQFKLRCIGFPFKLGIFVLTEDKKKSG